MFSQETLADLSEPKQKSAIRDITGLYSINLHDTDKGWIIEYDWLNIVVKNSNEIQILV